MKKESFASVLKNRGFLNLWTNQILVQFAYNSLNFALIIWVYYLTNSNTAISALLLAVYLPSLIFGVISGIFVDMIDRKKIIITIDLLLALTFTVLIFLKQIFPVILIFTFIINSLVQFYLPAESSSLPMLVKRKQLFIANSLFSTTLFSMFLVGFGLSGPIISILGMDFVFVIGALALFVAFLLANKFPSIKTVKSLKAKKLKSSLENRDFSGVVNLTIDQFMETMGIIRGRLTLFSSIFLLATVQTVVGVLAVLLPSFLEQILQISATDASLIVIIPLGIGMIFGALLLGKIGHFFPKRFLVGRAVVIAGSLLLLMGIAPLLSPAIQYFPYPKAVSFLLQPNLAAIITLGSLLLGAAVVSIIIPSQTVLQENTTKSERGKVFGALFSVMAGLSLLPILFAGILSDFFGTIPIFIVMGGFVSILGFLILKPDFFFAEKHLPFKMREFLGLGHWR